MAADKEVEHVKGKLRYIDEATTRGDAATSVNNALEMRALLKPHPAVLYLMDDDRYFEIDIKTLKKVITVEGGKQEGWAGWLTSWMANLSTSADKRLLQLIMEEEEDLFQGKKQNSVWLAAKDETERDMWKRELETAMARVAAGWTPPEKKEETKEIGHAHGPDDGHDHGHHHGHQNEGPKPDGPLRFAVGTKVFCNTGMWSPATIVAHNYRESDWQEGKTVPYQAELEEGGLIFCPADVDQVVCLNDGSGPPPLPEAEKEVDDADKTPVTVITGFLGAGKTTLVNYILTSKDHGMRIAIIENEFGAINIDEALVEDNLKTKEDLITMENGCICCTVRGDLINALQQLAERRHQLDAVIIETTGLADPGPVCVSFKMPQLFRHFRVDGIVCLVDAKHIEGHLKEKREAGTVNESAQQLGFSDKILLNKVDLVTRKDVERIKKVIRSVNGFADIIETQKSKVPLDRILGIDSFDVERSVDINPEMLQDKQEPCEEDMSCCSKSGCKKKQALQKLEEQKKAGAVSRRKHDLSGVGSLGLIYEGVISDSKFCKWLGDILKEEGFALNLYRCKGVLCLDADTTCKWVFQGVHDNILCKRSKKNWGPDEKRLNKVVFIGRDLDQDKLEKGFLSCKV